MRKSYKFRIKTKGRHERRCRRYCGHCRFVWNQTLALPRARLASGLPFLSYQDLTGLLRLWKQSEAYGFLREAHF